MRGKKPRAAPTATSSKKPGTSKAKTRVNVSKHRLPTYTNLEAVHPGKPPVPPGGVLIGGMYLTGDMAEAQRACFGSWRGYAVSSGKMTLTKRGELRPTADFTLGDVVWLPDESTQALTKEGFSKEAIQGVLEQLWAMLGVTAETPEGDFGRTISLEGVQRFRITSSDPRVALHGKEGLRATRALSKGTVIGTYQGVIMSKQMYEELKVTPPAGYPGGVAQWQVSLESYALDEQDMDYEEAEDAQGDQLVMIVSSFGYGNETSLLNDPLVGDLQGQAAYEACAAGANVVVLWVSVKNFRLPFVITTKDIKKNEELLYAYGWPYWEAYGPRLKLASIVHKEQQVLEQEIIKLKQKLAKEPAKKKSRTR